MRSWVIEEWWSIAASIRLWKKHTGRVCKIRFAIFVSVYKLIEMISWPERCIWWCAVSKFIQQLTALAFTNIFTPCYRWIATTLLNRPLEVSVRFCWSNPVWLIQICIVTIDEISASLRSRFWLVTLPATLWSFLIWLSLLSNCYALIHIRFMVTVSIDCLVELADFVQIVRTIF